MVKMIVGVVVGLLAWGLLIAVGSVIVRTDHLTFLLTLIPMSVLGGQVGLALLSRRSSPSDGRGIAAHS